MERERERRDRLAGGAGGEPRRPPPAADRAACSGARRACGPGRLDKLATPPRVPPGGARAGGGWSSGAAAQELMSEDAVIRFGGSRDGLAALFARAFDRQDSEGKPRLSGQLDS